MSSERRICLTGPARETAAQRWVDAVWTVPLWKPMYLPLVRVVPVPVHSKRVGVVPSFVAVTSQNALPALRKLWEQRTDVREAPHAAVGVATARALRTLGVDPEIAVPDNEAGAARLSEEILKKATAGQTVLWPRSNRASELRERLVVGGLLVDDPIAYRTEDVEGTVLPTRLNAAFFASPSAASVWLRNPEAPRVTAIAIGATTQAELAPDYARFTRIVRLAKPKPEALAGVLANGGRG